MMMTTTMCDHWQLIGLEVSIHWSNDSGFIFMIKRLMVQMATILMKDVRGTSKWKETPVWTDCFPPSTIR